MRIQLFFCRRIVFAFFLFALITGCSKTPKYQWYETVSMYHVFVKSFLDSDGDGKGDLKGLISKLDYIRSLNVNTIHMLPITPALNVDNMPRSHFGYEILDFKNVHSDYGSMEDFKTLVREAHKRGLHVVLDFITTVISVQHPFFQDILNNPDSPYKDWIITAPSVPEGEWMNFNDYKEYFESKAWKPLPHGGYYYSLWGNSPFLDYHNPKVREYIFSVVDFWLDAGADGIRIDATKHLYINGPGQEKQYHQPENFKFWKKLRKHIMDKYGPDKVLIAETVPIPNNYDYVLPNREMFDLMFDSTFINDVYPYKKTDIDQLYSAPFLHSFFDNSAFYKRTALKDRLMYHSDHDGARIATRIDSPKEDQLKVAASILTLTPAHVKLYAGDEIGIKGFSNFGDEKNKWFHSTTASMAWNNSFNGGFTTSYTPVLPITDDYRQMNVAEQEKRPESLLNHYRRLLKLKSAYPQLFFKGQRYSVPVGHKKVYSYLLNNGSDTALVVINLSKLPKPFQADLSSYNAGSEDLIFGDKKQIETAWNKGIMKIKSLPPYSTFVFKLKQFDASCLPKDKTTLEKTELIPADGTKRRVQKNTPVALDIPETGGVLRLFKGQGQIDVSTYSLINETQLSKYFQDHLDTSGHDVLLPVLPNRTNVFFFGQDNVEFAFSAELPSSVVPANLPLVASYDGNKNLSEFYAGQDDNFWYFKMKRTGDALPSNGGLDFIIFINTSKHRTQQRVGFWLLPEVVSRLPVNGMIFYERHIQTGRVQTDLNAMRNIGISESHKHLIFDQPDSFIVLVSKDVFPQKSLNVAPFVWSAIGKWGDKPPENKPLPIVERLPADPAEEIPSYFIKDYLKVE
ncbi:MAG: hypothetical protein IJ752_06440 [Alphaproteobacteria bacterium]|nr:hypothetical protein [Alphaproteobacteria bacterium]